MKNIEICKKAHCWYVRTIGEDIHENTSHGCYDDVITGRDNYVTYDEFVNSEPPACCKYRLEHMVMKGEVVNNNNKEFNSWTDNDDDCWENGEVYCLDKSWKSIECIPDDCKYRLEHLVMM